MGKYDIIDKHYHESREVLADLVGAELHERCERFPPNPEELDWLSPAFEKRFRLQLSSLPRPDAPLIALLARVLDLEIDHEIEEIDRIVKGDALKQACATKLHEETFHFLWQSLLHHLEERSAEMKVEFKRKDKHRIVESLRKRGTLVQLIEDERLSKLH